jgi:hypothetical protein
VTTGICPVGIPKKQAVLAFFTAMSRLPTQASSVRMKAFKLAPESTTAIHIRVSISTARFCAAARAICACSSVTCMAVLPNVFSSNR